MRIPAFSHRSPAPSRSWALASVAMACVAAAQSGSQPDYLNPNLPPEQRAADLVKRMTAGREGLAAGEPGPRHSTAQYPAVRLVV